MLPIAQEAFPFILVLVIALIGVWYFKPVLAIIPLLLLLFILFFFRDPERKIIANPRHILSPADGKVMAITEYYDAEYFKGPVKKVTIFLTVLNVHINRSPISGTVIYKEYRKGRFRPAFEEQASLLNERNTIGIANENCRVFVHQIAGLLARRIVCRSKVGDYLEQGQRFGLIKFGSCTEIIVPAAVEIKVKKNDTVKGGLTVIGIIE
ncbi:MAG: phosphatidylserine decarboxylase family protein [Bacillota bacterium]